MDVGGGFAGADSDDDDFYDTPDTFDDAAHRMTEVAGGEADREVLFVCHILVMKKRSHNPMVEYTLLPSKRC